VPVSLSLPLTRYLARHHLEDAVRGDGRATLMIDDRWRIHMHDTDDGCVTVTARLCALPAAGNERDAWLDMLGRDAVGMMGAHASGCVIDAREESLWLQQMVWPDGDDAMLDEAVGQFANALSYWTAAVRRKV